MALFDHIERVAIGRVLGVADAEGATVRAAGMSVGVPIGAPVGELIGGQVDLGDADARLACDSSAGVGYEQRVARRVHVNCPHRTSAVETQRLCHVGTKR